MLLNNIPNAQMVSWPAPFEKQFQKFFVSANQNEICIGMMNLNQQDTIIIGSTQIEQSISKIAWTTYTQNQKYQLGFILVGTQDGSVLVFEAQKIMNNTQNLIQHGLLCNEQGLFEAPVNSMEVNPFKPNLIAIGGENDVLIFNLEGNINDPQIFSPGQPNLHEENQGVIQCVAWNKKLAHILASADQNGLTVVWDLKTNKPIFNFQNQQSQGDVQVSLVWNPEIPTQICVGYSDEQETQIWDLRQSQGPVIQFDNSSEVMNLDWCSQDPNLIILANKDRYINIWNYRSGVKLGSFQLDQISTSCKFNSSLNGSFSISFQDYSQIYYLKPSHLQGYVFSWLNKKSGISLSNNAKMAMFQNGNVKEFKALPQQDEIFEQILDFEQRFQINDNKTIIQNLAQDNDEFYKYLNSKNKGLEAILEVLGFNKKEILNVTETITGKNYGQQQEEKKPQKKLAQKFNFGAMNEQDAENFFDQLGAQQKKTEPSLLQKQIKTAENEIIQQETTQKNINWKAGTESALKKNLLIGNYEGAVDCAIKCGRIQEAFLIAYSKDQSLVQNVIESWFASQQDPFIRNFFKNFVQGKHDEFGKNTNLDNWQEIIVYALTNKESKSNQNNILNTLGERFCKEKKDYSSSLICFLLADNFQQIVKILHQIIKNQKDKIQQNIIVIQCVQKILLLDEIKNIQGVDQTTQEILDSIYIDFACICQQYQKTIVAYKILSLASNTNRNVLQLKEQIYNQNLDPQFFQLYPKVPQSFMKIENFKLQQKKPQIQDQKKQIQPQSQQIFNQNKIQEKPKVNVFSVKQETQISDLPPQKTNQPVLQEQKVQHVQNFVQQQPIRPQVPPPNKMKQSVQNLNSQIEQKQVVQSPLQNIQPVTIQQKNSPFQPQQMQNQAPPLQKRIPSNQQSQSSFQELDTKKAIKQPEIEQKKIPQQNQFQPPTNQFSQQQTQFSQQQPQFSQQQPQFPQQLHQQPVSPPQPTFQQPPQQKPQQELNVQIKYKGPQDQIEYICSIIQNSKIITAKIEQNKVKRTNLDQQLDQLCQLVQTFMLKQQTFDGIYNLSKCLDQQKNQDALSIFSVISKDDWDINKNWLMALKRVLLQK